MWAVRSSWVVLGGMVSSRSERADGTCMILSWLLQSIAHATHASLPDACCLWCRPFSPATGALLPAAGRPGHGHAASARPDSCAHSVVTSTVSTASTSITITSSSRRRRRSTCAVQQQSCRLIRCSGRHCRRPHAQDCDSCVGHALCVREGRAHGWQEGWIRRRAPSRCRNTRVCAARTACIWSCSWWAYGRGGCGRAGVLWQQHISCTAGSRGDRTSSVNSTCCGGSSASGRV